MRSGRGPDALTVMGEDAALASAQRLGFGSLYYPYSAPCGDVLCSVPVLHSDSESLRYIPVYLRVTVGLLFYYIFHGIFFTPGAGARRAAPAPARRGPGAGAAGGAGGSFFQFSPGGRESEKREARTQ